MNLTEGRKSAEARGHSLAHDPPHVLASVDRYTCTVCGAAVLGNGRAADGSALDRDCKSTPTKEDDHG